MLRSVRFNYLMMIQITGENLVWINKYKYSLSKKEANRCQNYTPFGHLPWKEGSQMIECINNDLVQKILRGCYRKPRETQKRKSEMKSSSFFVLFRIFLIFVAPFEPNLALMSPIQSYSWRKCWIQANSTSFLEILRSIKLDLIVLSFILIISSSLSSAMASLKSSASNWAAVSMSPSFFRSYTLTSVSKISFKVILVGCFFLVSLSQMFWMMVLLEAVEPTSLMYLIMICFIVITSCLVIL